MNAMRKQAADELPVRYRVRVSVPTDRKLRDVARALGYESPAAYLRALALNALQADVNHVPMTSASDPPVAPTDDQQAALPELRQALARLEAKLDATAEHRTGGTDMHMAELKEALKALHAIARASLYQSTSASYLGVHLWRLLADPKMLPPAGLPPQMRDEIKRLNGRVIAGIEQELGA
jgi:acyl-homoserine lactone acylase PvdQ